jgi:hypothetical protein
MSEQAPAGAHKLYGMRDTPGGPRPFYVGYRLPGDDTVWILRPQDGRHWPAPGHAFRDLIEPDALEAEARDVAAQTGDDPSEAAFLAWIDATLPNLRTLFSGAARAHSDLGSEPDVVPA